MKRWPVAVAFVLAAGLLAAGCQAASSTSPTSPTTTGVGAATIASLSTGTWASLAADPAPGTVIFAPNTCGNFKWAITSLTLVSAAGTFSASCGGGLDLTGNATVTLAGTTANWGAVGTVTGADAPCSFAVSGTAALESGFVRVAYSGNVCGTAISGSELVKKR